MSNNNTNNSNNTTDKKKLVFAKVEDGQTLNTTKMEINTTISGELKALEANKYGDPEIVLSVKGKETRVKPSGNMKAYLQKYGNQLIGQFVSFTRREDVVTKNGYKMTNFTTYPRKATLDGNNPFTAPAAKQQSTTSVRPLALETATTNTESSKDRILAKLKAQNRT